MARTGLVRYISLSSTAIGVSSTFSGLPSSQRRRRPIRSGCSVLTNTVTRHSGRPSVTSRAHISSSTPSAVLAVRAPSTSHPIVPRTSAMAALSPAGGGEKTSAVSARMKDDAAQQHVDGLVAGGERQHQALPGHIVAPGDPQLAAPERRAPLLHHRAPDQPHV